MPPGEQAVDVANFFVQLVVAGRPDDNLGKGRTTAADGFCQRPNFGVGCNPLAVLNPQLPKRAGQIRIHINSGNNQRAEKISLARFVDSKMGSEPLWLQNLLVAESHLTQNLRLQNKGNKIFQTFSLQDRLGAFFVHRHVQLFLAGGEESIRFGFERKSACFQHLPEFAGLIGGQRNGMAVQSFGFGRAFGGIRWHGINVNKADLHRNLIAWFRRNGRDLPWRRTTDPYAITVSEFMLQQTRVTAVVPYFEKWMHRFPTVQSLADAKEEEVLRYWQGLGYYSRARNLHALARVLADDWHGVFPESPDALENLPGIGAYTASAIAAFAHDQPAPVVDANIARVLSRWADYRKPIDTSAGKKFLHRMATDLQPLKNGRLWNSAVMELGALICRSGKPDCLLCPVRKFCRGKNPAVLPRKKPRAITTALVEQRALVLRGGKIYLELSTGPRWKGLWVLPLLSDAPDKAAPILRHRYPITRYQVTMEVFLRRKLSCKNLVPHDLDNWAELPLPSPHRRAVAQALASMHS